MRLRGTNVALALLACLLVAGCVTTGSKQMQRAHSKSDKEKAARVHTQLGVRYYRQGNLETALQKLQTALDFEPDYAPAHTVLGALYHRLGEMDKAQHHYHQAVKAKPDDGKTNNNYAVFLCERGEVDKAMPYFRKALDDPFYNTPASAWANSGICQMRAGDAEEARRRLQKALSINPRHPDALSHMARLLHQQGDNFHANAYVQRYLGMGDSDPQILQLGYEIETALGDAEGARKYAHRLRDKFPDSEQAQSLDAKPSP